MRGVLRSLADRIVDPLGDVALDVAFSLPGTVQVALAGMLGEPRVTIEGERLDPGSLLALAFANRLAGDPPATLDEARASMEERIGRFAGSPPAVGHVEDLAVPGPGGEIPARWYLPVERDAPLPLVVWFHGGGWALGSVDAYDHVARLLAAWGNQAVLSVGYRLAPEHRFPAALEDAEASLRWAMEQARDIGGDPQAVVAAGDSAGANLATVAAVGAARSGGPAPAAQMLLYPVTDLSRSYPSTQTFATGFSLAAADMDWFRDQYLASRELVDDPRVSPVLTEDLAGVAPAYVATSGFDVVRDQGEAYARRLRDAGVPTLLRRHRGLLHGWVVSAGRVAEARAALYEALAGLRWLLRGDPL